MIRTCGRAAALVLSALALAACGETEAAGEESGVETTRAALPAAGEPWRAIWVTRFDYRTEEDVVRAIARCADAGFNRVLFQVRGDATAFYRSTLEPWAEQLGGADPGYDPLQVACDAAHARGVELHAWFNVMPMWWGTEPPTDPGQLWNARPEWAWYDASGNRAPLVERFYASVNPCLPEVRAHIEAVALEVLAYPIDGLHLDYVRFPTEAPVPDVDWPRDARTLELYREATGLAPDDDPVAWTDWRCEAVTDVVRDVRRAVDEVRPGIWLSAAVGAAPEQARADYFQDARAWLEEGLLDASVPMNYTSDPAAFEARLALWTELSQDAPVVVGVSAEGTDVWSRHRQVARARREVGGFSLFAFASLFETPNATTTETTEAARVLRERRREVLLPLLSELATWDRADEGGEVDEGGPATR